MVYLPWHVKSRYAKTSVFSDYFVTTTMDGFSVSLAPRWTPKKNHPLGCKEQPDPSAVLPSR